LNSDIKKEPEENSSLSDSAEIRKLVEDRKLDEAKSLEGKQDSKSNIQVIDTKFVIDCLYKNEVGDGVLFSELHKDKYVFDKNDKTWFIFNGHHWEIDILNCSRRDVENVCQRYLDEAFSLGYKLKNPGADKDEQKEILNTQSKIYKRVFKLRSENGRHRCLECAHTNQQNSLAVAGNEVFDLDPYLLGVSNGVVDLRTGILRAGRPDDYIFRASPHEWKDINEPALKWQEFLESTFSDDNNIISFVQRLFGYAISGLTSQRKFIILHGQGQNGKGVLINLFYHVMGPLAVPIQAEMLLDQGRTRSSSAPSPDIMALKGVRMAFASESDEGRRFSASRVKWLSGGDKLVGRTPHASYDTAFSPSHMLCLLTNNKPHAASHEFALWERVILIPFEISFVDREPKAANERRADLFLEDKLKKEASGILAWLVKGFIRWMEIGLSPPSIVEDATKKYRREEDLLADFIEENCYTSDDPSLKTSASLLYTAFDTWFIANISKKSITPKKLSKLLQKAGFERVKEGTIYYYGIGLISE